MKLKFIRSKLLAEYCKQGGILDVGFAALPNKFLKDAYGIDIVLPNKKPESYKEMARCNLNIENIPYKNGFFNNIVAGDVIEHLENPSHFLREANRVLADNGRLIICTPQANDLWTTLHNWFFRNLIKDNDPEGHLQNWTMLDMKRLLNKNGFKLQKVEGFFTRFPKIKLHIRVKKIPALSWQVFYIAEKCGQPKSGVPTAVDGKLLRVRQ